jgi:hypothetical protein
MKMLHRDISQFDVTKIPETKALQNQRQRSLDPFEQFWLETLERGFIRLNDEAVFQEGEWAEKVSTSYVYDSFVKWRNNKKIKSNIQLEQVGASFKSYGYTPTRMPRNKDKVNGEKGHRPNGYFVGTLEEAIVSFTAAVGIDPIPLLALHAYEYEHQD